MISRKLTSKTYLQKRRSILRHALAASLFLLFFLLTTTQSALAGWNQVISPTSENLNGTWFADANTGVCVGDNGAVVRTSDGGMSFSDASISGGTNLNGVHFAPDVVGVVSYEDFESYVEEDNNAPEPDIVTVNPSTTNRYELSVSGDSVVGDDVYVYTDYGAGHFSDAAGFDHLFEFTLSPGLVRSSNWTCPWVVDNAITQFMNLASGYSYCTFETPSGAIRLELYNNNTAAFANVNIDKAYRDTVLYGQALNDGVNQTVSVYSDAARTVLVSSLTVAASNSSYRYLYGLETDGDAVWHNNLNVANIDIQEPTAYIAASGDNVYRSTSSGSSWWPDNTGSAVQLNDVHFYDDQNGWAVGENGTIYITSNAGETWASQTTGSASLQSVFFIDANNGWIAGTGGSILYTNNGGTTWNPAVSGVPVVDLYDIHFVSTTTGWAVGFNGTIIKTTDGGLNWLAQTATTTNQLNGVYFVDAGTGYATGMADTIIKTIDGGTTWTLQTSPSLGNNFNALYFVDANTGYICGDGGAILQTIDGGTGAAGNQIVLHPTASTATDDFALNGCGSSFDCVNDQPGNAATGNPVAVEPILTSELDGVNGNQVLFDLADSGTLGIPVGSTIDSIEIFAQAYRDGGPGIDYLLGYDIGGGLVSEPTGTALVTGNFQLMSYSWTSLGWTTTDLDNLKIGLTQSGNNDSHLGQLYVSVSYTLPTNTPPTGGYIADDIIPAAQVTQATDGTGFITINWKVRDDQPDTVTLLTFEYSDDGGSTWYTPTNGDASASLAANWNDNGGSGWATGTLFSNAPVHTFTFDTQHADLSGRLAGVDQSDVQVRFTLNDGTINSTNPATSENFRVDNLIPTSTITSGSYDAATDTLTITGTNFLSIDPVTTDIKAYVDWTKFIWDTNGDGGTTADIGVVLAEVTSLTITSDSTLTLVFTGAKATALEAAGGYGGSGGLDTLDVTAGFIRDQFGNAATSDAVADGPLDVEAPATITDLAINGAPTSSTVSLTWTSPGDDLGSGAATTYDIRYSTSLINDGNWAAATQVAGESAPLLAGSTEFFTVGGLNPTQQYYFAIKTSDEIPLESMLSNVVNATTGSPPSGTYYWQQSNGASVAGFTTNSPGCTSEDTRTSLVTTTMSAGGFGCNDIRIESGTGDPMDFILMINDTAYLGQTQVTGVDFRLKFRDEGGGGLVARYELGYAQGGIFTSWGSVDTPPWDDDSVALVTALNTISGTAPAGSHLAYKIIFLSGNEMRLWFGGSNNNSGILNVNEIEGDTVPPAAISDLSAIKSSPTSVDLSWTAPGDDDNSGTASGYDIRYSTSLITDANWAAATQVVGEPAPQVAGSSESYTVTGLTAGPTYYFAIKTRDEVPNISLLSNVDSDLAVADVSLSITDAPDPAPSGGGLLYTLTVDNNGPDTATTVTLTNTLPASVSLQSATPSQGSCSGTTTITCDLGAILTTNSAYVEILVVTSGSGTITNNASVTADGSDPVPGNNSATEDTDVILTSNIIDTPLTVYDRLHGFIDYTVTGGTLRTQPNSGDPCALTASSTEALAGIPGTATIRAAYLYWGGTGATVDDQVTFNGTPLTADRTFTAEFSLGANVFDFFGGFEDVTAIVQATRNGNYTFTDLTVADTGRYCSYQAVLAGWSLVVVYEDSALSAKTFVVYDGFDIERNGSSSYLLSGIYAVAPPEAKTSYVFWEGDPNLGSNQEFLEFNGIAQNDALNPVDSIYNSTINSLGANTSYGLDLDTFDVSALVSDGDTTATTTASAGPDLVILNSVVLQVKTDVIVGFVFDDVNYGGGDGRDFVTAVAAAPSLSVGRPNATVELYDNTGAFIRATTTDANGRYGFAGLPDGSYTVRVVNDTVTPARAGAVGSEWPVQTYRTDASSGTAVAVIDEVGGVDPTVQDDPLNGTSANLFTITAQSLAPAQIINGTTVIDVDFGFNFDTVVNINDTGQGSLREFIENSNVLDNTNLAQAGQTAGDETSIFMISDGAAHPGLRVGLPNQLAGGVATISPLSVLPSISGGNGNSTSINGSTQTANVGDTNNLGPEVEINGVGAGAASGITVNSAGTVTIQELVLNRFGDDGILVTGSSSNVAILGNFIGVNGTGSDDNSFGNSNEGIHIEGTVDTVTIGGSAAGEGNIISANGKNGIYVGGTAVNIAILGNSIGIGQAGSETTVGNGVDGVFVDSGAAATNVVVGGVYTGEGNIIAYSSKNGVRIDTTGTGNEIKGNTIRDNQWSGIESHNDGLLIAKNLIWNNLTKSGISTPNGDNNQIYQNTIHGNNPSGINIARPGSIIRNNIITGNGDYGINDGDSITENHNLITDNATAPINVNGQFENATADLTDITADPLYVNAAGGDFTLTECTSPAINAGIDLGGDQPDMNDVGVGLWNASAPDMGAFETSCAVILNLVKEARLLDGTLLGASTTIAAGTRFYFVIYVDNTTGSILTDSRIVDTVITGATNFTVDNTSFEILNNVGPGIDMNAANITAWAGAAPWLGLTWDAQTVALGDDYLDWNLTTADTVTVGQINNVQLDVPVSAEADKVANPHRTAFRFIATINP